MSTSILRTRREAELRPRKFMRVSEAAAQCGVSDMTLYRLISRGEFPAVRIGSRLVIPTRAIDDMIDAAIADQTVVDAADFVASGGATR